ncbi:MAG: hypothetical protein SFU98_03570 [Leptospiraceae bacterium]|nr:hypothetical protein [Leptospiraceae bacterium]
MKILYWIVLLYANNLLSYHLCTTKDFYFRCGVLVKEEEIDLVKISPSRNCNGLFLWYPKNKLESNCYICGNKDTITLLSKVKKHKPNHCGKVLKIIPEMIYGY